MRCSRGVIISQDTCLLLQKNLTLGLSGIVLGLRKAISSPRLPVINWYADLSFHFFLSFFLSFLSVAVIYIDLCLRQGKNMETM